MAVLVALVESLASPIRQSAPWVDDADIERVSTGGACGRLSLSQNWLLDNVGLLWKATFVNSTRFLARSLSDSKTLLRATQPGAL